MTSIDARLVHRILLSLHQRVLKSENYLNGLNVFPVPDGDTGVNIALTLQAGLDSALPAQLRNVPAGAYLRDFARAMLLGCRGCSGAILALYCKGVAEILADGDFSCAHVGEALKHGYEIALSGVANPTEGTILTIMREISKSYLRLLCEESDPSRIIDRNTPYLRDVLERTPEMLPALKKAGVVDAGGAGLIILLEGLSQELDRSQSGRKVKLKHLLLEISRRLRRVLKYHAFRRYAGKTAAELPFNFISNRRLGSIIERSRRFFDGGYPAETSILQDIKDSNSSWGSDIRYRYCTELLLDTRAGEDAATSNQRIRDLLADQGDSLMILRDEAVSRIHIHTNCPGCVKHTISSLGQVTASKIDDMEKQHHNFISDHNVACERERAVFFCVTSGNGFKRILVSLGAHRVLDYGSRKPSVEQLVKHIDRLGARNVVSAADDRDIMIALKYAASLSRANVIVLETDSPVALVSVLIALPKKDDISRTAVEATKLLGAVRSFSIAKAILPAHTSDGRSVHKGEFIALCKGDIVATGHELVLVLAEAVRETLENETLLTLYHGRAVKNGMRCAEQLRSLFPELEVEDYYGGQRMCLYYVALE